jgi:dephospho-CoA kinase
MIVVGLTGGVATGKSTVAKMLQRCGAHVIDADVLARQVVEPDKPAWREIVATFGRKVLRSDRSLNRAALARIVFRHPGKLRRLGAIIHPRVAREQARLTRAIGRHHPHAVVIYDAPVLIEAGAHERMDALVVVTADRATQINRLRRRNGLSRAEALRRIRSQMALPRKVRLADHVLDGTRPLDSLRQDVRRLYDTLATSA